MFTVDTSLERSKGFLPYVRSNPISKAKGHINEFELLYSDYPSYAVGHGCSPLWNNDSKEISKISAVHIPISEVKPVKASNLIIKDQVVPLSMELMSSEDKKDEIIDLLEIFTEFSRHLTHCSVPATAVWRQQYEGSQQLTLPASEYRLDRGTRTGCLCRCGPCHCQFPFQVY